MRQLGMFVAGVSIYLVIPLRALTNPPVNWGNAITQVRFWWLVSGQLYQSYDLQFSPVELWGRVQAWASLLLQQWGLIGFILALIGLVYFFPPSRLLVFTLWQVIVYSGFAILYGSFDSYFYLLPVCISFSIWIGIGLSGLWLQPFCGNTGLAWRSVLYSYSIFWGWLFPTGQKLMLLMICGPKILDDKFWSLHRGTPLYLQKEIRRFLQPGIFTSRCTSVQTWL